MNRSGSYSRVTPSAGTSETGGTRAVTEGRASRAVARALGQLVGRLMILGAEPRADSRADSRTEPRADSRAESAAGSEAFDARLGAVRDALRQLASRSRDGAMLCRVVNGLLVLEGEPVRASASTDDPLLRLLISQLNVMNVGSLTIREGAAPGELLTLARMLSAPETAMATRATTSAGNAETPTAVHAVDFANETPSELLRTWSVLVTPVVPVGERASAVVASGTVLAQLIAARSDSAATVAANAVVELLDDLQERGDAVAVEAVARVCLGQLSQIGEQGGRLALERVLRRLARGPLLGLLAKQLPVSTDRSTLVKLFARAGDVGVSILIDHLLTTDDSMSRRAYFDSIVAMDVGSEKLFTALSDSRWYVVRNAAALLGEMGVEYADEALIALLKHDDERIRIAVSRALMRLRTNGSLLALHHMIEDPNSEVRRLSAAAYGLSGSAHANNRPPAARLAQALEHEVDEDAALEMMAALGRLGSADAVQRLMRIAQPPTADITGAIIGEKREAWLRIAALEALVKARGHQMQPVVDSLLHDEDAEVAQAAAELLGR